MFDVRVKTLDGATHEFSVPDDATVSQFKELVRSKLSIEVERQRLLYQGRVLQDDQLMSFYNVAGNVMHLVTRPPPTTTTSTAPQNESADHDEHSETGAPQMRAIINEVFGELNGHLGSYLVNNEGNQVDITVNIPGQNRLSLARLRQNYIHRLLNQARNVIQHMRDPSTTQPRPDRERLFQANAYNLGPNEERLTEVTSQPLPIHNLADIIVSIREMWHDAVPQLEIWENVLRRQNLPENISNSDSEMQRLHDSASRFCHLFSHVLHIMSDYLVEFQRSNNVRVPTQQRATNEAATSASMDDSSTPMTCACGESGSDQQHAHHDTEPTITNPSNTNDTNDRSRYLYVFSEMPPQYFQVRVDVDSTFHDIRPNATAPGNAAPQSQQPVSQTQPQFQSQPRQQVPTQSQTAAQTPNSVGSGNAQTTTTTTTTASSRRQRRDPFGFSGVMENAIRSTLQDSIMSSIRPSLSNGGSQRITRSASHFMETVDPYVRCQSRHFQHPSATRSGFISTIGGIRLRETSRNRSRNNETIPTSRSAPTGTTETNTQTSNSDSMSLRNIISSVLAGDDIGGTTNATTVQDNTDRPAGVTGGTSVYTHDVSGLMDSFVNFPQTPIDIPLGRMFSEVFQNQNGETENFVTNRIIQLVLDQLNVFDFLQIMGGVYQPLNSLRVPLQEILMQHETDVGSRDRLIENVVSDLEMFNRAYLTVFERLQSSESISELSETARNSFCRNIDVITSLNNLNRYHTRAIVDMVLRSPTDVGFGQLLMNSMISHHDESLALLDVLCGGNDELRLYLIRSVTDHLMTSFGSSSSLAQFMSRGSFDSLLGDGTTGIFRRPTRLAELRDVINNSYVVYRKEEGQNQDDITNDKCCTDDNSLPNEENNLECIDDIVNNLSGGLLNGAALLSTDLSHPLETRVDSTGNITNTTTESMDISSPEDNSPSIPTQNGATSWRNILPSEWIQVVSRDTSNSPLDSNNRTAPYSDAYVSGMPPKRRKVILTQRHRNLQSASELMTECIDQAVRASGFSTNNTTTNSNINVPPLQLNASLSSSFQEMVTEQIQTRLTEESFNFPTERFPTADNYFARRKRTDDDKKKN